MSAPSPRTFQVKDRVYNTGTVAFSDKITELYGKPERAGSAAISAPTWKPTTR